MYKYLLKHNISFMNILTIPNSRLFNLISLKTIKRKISKNLEYRIKIDFAHTLNPYTSIRMTSSKSFCLLEF